MQITGSAAIRGLVSALSSLLVVPRTSGVRALHAASGTWAELQDSGEVGVRPDFRLSEKLAERLQRIAARCDELGAQLSGPSAGTSSIAALTREFGVLQPVAENFKQLMAAQKEMTELSGLLKDPDPGVAKLAAEELASLGQKAHSLQVALLEGLLPGQVDEQRDAILEVRAGTGGAEASLFAADLMTLYNKLADSKGWTFEMLEASSSEAGGYRTASASISGPGAYGCLKWEAGVHRVQRVPVTETMGRIHTSTASVAVLPQADEVEMAIREEDLLIDTMRASGAGGQHVNTTSSAVRITHLPTGTVVTCQDERSQLRNRAKAMRVLRARLFEAKRAKEAAAVDAARKVQVGTGERNERIRTYNFAQDRLTDHRVGITQHGLEDIMSGSQLQTLDEVHAALSAAERAEQLSSLVDAA